MKNKKGQVWLETVIYTLVGLALIGMALAIITPKINQARDRIVVEQSIEVLTTIDDVVKEVMDRGPANSRVIEEMVIKKGELTIDSKEDTIYFVINGLTKPYSQPGVPIKLGAIEVLSEENQKLNSVRLLLNYSRIANLTYSSLREDNMKKKFSPAGKPYKIVITNYGVNNNKIEINIKESLGG